MTSVREICEKRPFAVALFVALVLLLVPYRVLLGPGVPSGRDLIPYFYPLKTHLAEAVRAGEMPWIDRFRQGGLPLLAWPGVAAFDPGNLLFVLLPTAAAAKAWMLLRVLTGSAGFAVFLRLSGLPPLSSALGGLAWGAAGITASAASFLSTSSAYAALPWLAAALLRVRSRRDGRSLVLLAAATAFLLVASVPEPLLAASLLALVLLAGRGPSSGPLERGKTLLLWVAGGLLGTLLAAPVVATYLVTGAESIRGVRGALLPGFAEEGSLPPIRLAELLADGVVADWTRTSAAPGIPDYPYFPSLTPGRVAWTLALLGLLLGRGARLRATTIAALGVLLALGPATPVAEWISSLLPFATAIRYPEKWLVLFAFGIAWLVALGAAVLEKAVPARRLPVFGLLGLFLALDRSAITPRLLPTSEARMLDEAPAVLTALPVARVDTPPRILPIPGTKRVPGAVLPTPAAGGRATAAWVLAWSYTRFGVASVFEMDYDAALPRAQLEWANLVEDAPLGSPLAIALARSAGAEAVVVPDRGPGGLPVAGLRRIANPVSPFRFVRRVVREPDALAASSRFLRERAPVDLAVLSAPGVELVPSRGRILRVSDRPARLEIEVAVDGPEPAYLFVARPLVAARRATLDGRPVSVDDANVGFTGLSVPPGRHVVRLQPSGRWLIIAAVMSAVALLGLTFVRRRSPSRGGDVV
ncbi:MAG TPA: hypothetical protein PLL76_14220 [Thermoanaerobaculia bacterium]|nr:hypothetical protein [Thermoanaerobaculia bacterium]